MRIFANINPLSSRLSYLPFYAICVLNIHTDGSPDPCAFPSTHTPPIGIRRFCVFALPLIQVEQGSKNHEIVPSALIAQLAGARSGGVNKALGELAKKKLVAKVQNAKCTSAPPFGLFD